MEGHPDGDEPVLRRFEELLSRHGLRHAESGTERKSEFEKVKPAWQRQTAGERRAAVTIATLVAIALIVALPPRVENRPWFLAPGLALLMLIALVIANPLRLERHSPALRRASLILIAVLSIANAVSGVRLVVDLIRGRGIHDPAKLLATGAAIWLTNVIVFSLWYWDSDRGGPVQRAMGVKERPDFLFPQMQLDDRVPGFADWEPMYVDYLYLSFTNATAFSPTDVVPLSRWAKLVMMVQATISVVTVALVIARAVNVLK